MNNQAIYYDNKKLILNMIVLFFLVFILTLVSAYSYSISLYLVVLFSIPAVWLCVKRFWNSLKIVTKKIPLCVFNEDGISIHLINGDKEDIKYKNLDSVKIMERKFDYRVLIYAQTIKHPSKMCYISFSKQSVQYTENALTEIKTHLKRYIK